MECPKCKGACLRHGTKKFAQTGRAQQYMCKICGHMFSDKSRLGKSFVRVFIGGDFHCGHTTGLTPPKYNSEHHEYFPFREESWKWYSKVLKQMQPFDVAILNGDLVDGKQKKSGGLELLVTSVLKQAEMAQDCIKEINAYKNIIVRGTPYHTGKEENYEDLVAISLGCGIYDKFLGDIGGKIFDVRHKIGRSGVPHTKATPLGKQMLWSRLRAERTGIKADIIIRNHVHYYISLDDRDAMAFTCPALQGYSSYGAKECDGEVDYGFIVLDVYPDGRVLKHIFITEFNSNKEVVVTV